MPRGGPDDGRLPSNVSGTTYNPAIDTARGSGFALLDNLGRLVLYDNFTDGLGGWAYTPTGVRPGLKVRRDNLAFPLSGLSPFGPSPVVFYGQSVTNSGLRKSLVTPQSGRIGLEIGLRSDNGGVSSSWLECRLTVGSTTGNWSFAFRYLPSVSAGQLEIAGVWTTVYGFNRGGAGWDWWRFKMVVDPVAATYDGLTVPGAKLSALGAGGTALGIGIDQIRLSIDCPSGAVTPSNEYLGYVSLTQDEP